MFNIQNVTGSQGDDLIVGDANPNVLVGGAGRAIIIGGNGPDNITGGGGDNILISGTTLKGSLTFAPCHADICSVCLATGGWATSWAARNDEAASSVRSQ